MKVGPGNDNCREKADNYTEGQGNRETLNHAGAEVTAKNVKDQTGNERRRVRVADGGPCTLPAKIDGLSQGFSGPQFFFSSFEDQNIRINRHTNTQDETGDARQGQNNRNDPEKRQREQGIRYQRQVGYEAG